MRAAATTTTSIGTMRAGDWASSVPAWCRLDCRIAIYPGTSADALEYDEYLQRASGSGVVIVNRGKILTSLHVVSGSSAIKLTFADGTQSRGAIASEQPLEIIGHGTRRAIGHPMTTNAVLDVSALNAVTAGHVDFFFDTVATSVPQHRAGTVRIIILPAPT